MSDTIKDIDINNPDIEDTGDLSERTRAWFLTLHIKNFENLGLEEDFYKDPPKLAKHLSNVWNNSGKDRSCAVVICESAQGLYHAHMACYCKGGITRNAIRELMGNAHCDAQRGSKKQLREYMLKIGVHEQKGENVLISLGLDNIQSADKTDLLTEARKKFNDGYTVADILREDARYYRHHTDEILKKMYLDKLYYEMPSDKVMEIFWHCGKSGSGKTQVYRELVKEFGEESVYYISQLQHGAFDMYAGEKILFIDELRPYDTTYTELLNIFSDVKAAQTHCRYGNKRNLWTTVHIATVYKPYEFYEEWFMKHDTQEQKDAAMHKDPFEQLRRRLTAVIYHKRIDDNNYTSYEIPNNMYYRDKDIEDFIEFENGQRNLMEKSAKKDSAVIADRLNALYQNIPKDNTKNMLDSFGAKEI